MIRLKLWKNILETVDINVISLTTIQSQYGGISFHIIYNEDGSDKLQHKEVSSLDYLRMTKEEIRDQKIDNILET